MPPLLKHRLLAMALLWWACAPAVWAQPAETEMPPTPFQLTQEERAWLAAQHTVRGGNLAIANFLIKRNRFTNLVVAAGTPYGQHTQGMAVRRDWPALASLINKGLAVMTPAQINAINQKWGAVEIRPQIDYTLVWQVVAGATLLFLAVFYWNRRLAREVAIRQRIAADLQVSEADLMDEKRRLQQAQHALQHLNQTLEDQVRHRTTELQQTRDLAGLGHASGQPRRRPTGVQGFSLGSAQAKAEALDSKWESPAGTMIKAISPMRPTWPRVSSWPI